MTSYEMLLEKIRQVRRRWRSHALVRGIAVFLASAIALLVLGVWGADLFGFKPAAVWCMRILTGGLVLFTAWYFLYLPLRVRVSDIAIAQFIEEKYPNLEDRLVTAVEYGGREMSNEGMITLLIKDALKQTARVDLSVFLNRKRLLVFGSLGLAAAAALLAILTWGPAFFPYGFSSLYIPWAESSGFSPVMINVVPGDTEIAEGSEQLIDAQLVGFDSPDVRLYRRSGESGQWSSAAMEPDPRGSAFRYLLVDVRTSQQYYVESKGVRTPVYSLEVVKQSRVEKLDLTYNFPAYTGMSPQTVEDEGDISALKGTKMDLKVRLSIPVRSARLLFDDGSALDLSAAGSGEFSGSFVLDRSGSYTVQVKESRGNSHPASPEYDIEALEDEAPKVTVSRPMRDVRATSLEEIFTEVKAEDDIAMGKVQLHYSVNGAPEQTVDLYSGKPPERSVTAAHTFFLEDFNLQPGDLISYYADARDGNNATGPAAANSDIYFIQIRPFQQDYKQSQQQSMSGSGGSGEGEQGQQALSRQQKEIISATFKLIQEKERMDPKEYGDGLDSLSTVQSRLQAQAQGLVDRLRRREAEQAGENFQMLGEYLRNAIAEMGKAAVDLGGQMPSEALPQEQKSLQQLMRAESLFRDIQVSFSAQNSQGRSSRTSAEDLADLFELELNKLKNQYETVQRAEQQERDEKTDEALKRLEELAQRQQQLNENNRMRMQQGGSPSSSGSQGGSQRQQQLLDQAEQLQRQLQKLSRERSSPQLNEAGNRIQKAIEEMKKALNDSKNRSGTEQSAQAERALQQLNEAIRGLANNQGSDLKKGLEQAVRESGNLLKQQEKIQEELDRLAREMQPDDSFDDAARRSEDVVSRKNTLADSLDNLEDSVSRLSRQARKSDKETSARLGDAADTIQERKLSDRIKEGNMLIQNGFFESQQRREEFIRDSLEDVQEQLKDAQNRLGESASGRIEEAANRARELSEGLESMQRRLSEIQRGQQDQQGQQQAQGQQQGQQQGQGRQARGQQPGQRGQQQGQQAQGQRQGQRQGQQQGQQGQQQAQGRQQGQGQRQGRGFRQDPSGQRAQNGRGSLVDRQTNPQQPQRGEQDPNATGEFTDNGFRPEIGTGAITDDRARQFYRELDERMNDAEDLRRMMNRNPTLAENLEKVIDALAKSRDYADVGNSDQAALLKDAVANMQGVEADLARELRRLKQLGDYFIAGDNEAPEAYRKLVEEYYKSLAGDK